METIFCSRDLSLQEYSKKFEYFKEKFKIFEDLKKYQKIGKSIVYKKKIKKKITNEETLEKKNEEMENNEKNNIRIEVGESKTGNEKTKKIIEEISEDSDENEETSEKSELGHQKDIDEENMYNSEDENEEQHEEDEDLSKSCENNVSKEEYCVYEAGFTQKLSRWWWNENREKTFKYLDEDFNEFVEFLDNIKLHTTSINYLFYSKLIRDICNYCNKIIPGLYNLKETYENITKMKAKIDSIIMILIDFKAEMAVLRKRQKALYSKIKRY